MSDEKKSPKRPPRPGEGRPSKYPNIDLGIVTKVAALGATDAEIADILEIDIATLYRWKNQKPEFCEALKAGKAPADERVERSLYQRAVGYTFDSEKVFQFQGQIIRTPVREHVPPDTTAAIFWLKNRDPENWRDKQQVEHSGSIDVSADADSAKRKLSAALAAGSSTKMD